MKNLLFFCILAVVSLHVQARTVKGKVLDEQKQPLPYANVVLLSLPDSAFVKGTVTDMDGCFSLSEVSDAAALIRVSSIGYRTAYRLCGENTSSALVIALEPDAVLLREAVVTGYRPTYKMKGSSLITEVSNSLLSNLGSAEDVLSHIPLVQESNGGFTVFGKGTPLIYLNGREMRDLNELKRLNAKDIQNVEVVMNPGSEYDATVKAVIKIKTVKPQGEGIGGQLWVKGARHEKFNHEELFDLNYRKGGFDVFGSFYYTHQNKHTEQHDVHHIETDNVWDHDASLDIYSKNEYLNANGGMNYMFNDRHSMGVKYSFSRTPRLKSDLPSSYRTFLDGDWYDNQTYQRVWSGSDYSHLLNMYYAGTVGKLGIDFNADYYQGKSFADQVTDETSESQENRYVSSKNEINNRLYAAKLVLTHPAGKGDIKGGAEFSATRRTDWYNNEQSYLPSSDTKNEEDKTAVFAEYSAAFGALQATVGLRYEHVVSNYFDKGVWMDEQSRTYDNILPSVALSFPLRETRWSLSYTAKTRRPSYHELSSNIQYNDRFTYEGGNPFLQPETLHDVTLMGSYRWIQLMANYIYKKDVIEMWAEPYGESSEITFLTTKNYDKKHILNLSLVLSPKIGCWEPVLSMVMSQQYFTIENFGAQRDMNNPTGIFTLDNNFRFKKGWTANVLMSAQTAGEFGVWELRPKAYIDLSVNKSFLNDCLNVRLDVKDPFETNRQKMLFRGITMTFDKDCYHDERCVSLSITYRFNASASKYKGTGAANEELNRL